VEDDIMYNWKQSHRGLGYQERGYVLEFYFGTTWPVFRQDLSCF